MGVSPPPLTPDVLALLRAAPKVELRLHLDGAMALPWLLERVHWREAGVATLEGLRARPAFRTFDEFIERWVWKCGFHPLRRLVDAGVRVTVNSDDPTFFGASVLDELELCLTPLGFAPRELAVLTEHAAEAAFLEDAARERLRARVRFGWAGLRPADRIRML